MFSYPGAPQRPPFPASAQISYISIKSAGDGTQGIVYFCLPKAFLPTSLPVTPGAFDAIRSKVVAVKVINEGPNSDESKEPLVRQLLEELGSALNVDTIGLQRFLPQVVDTHLIPQGVEQPWYAMSAIHGLTLHQLQVGAGSPLPPALIAHVFISVHSALKFLESKRISHRDIHGHNVMLELKPLGPAIDQGQTDQQSIRFPHVYLIDLGLAGARQVSEFCPDALRVIYLLNEAMGYTGQVCEPWRPLFSPAELTEVDAFYASVDGVLKLARAWNPGKRVGEDGEPKWTLDGVWNKWGGSAENIRTNGVGMGMALDGEIGSQLSVKIVEDDDLTKALQMEGILEGSDSEDDRSGLGSEAS